MANLFTIFFNNLLPIFLAAGVGALISWKAKLDVKHISKVLFYVFTPCLVYESILNNYSPEMELGKLMLVVGELDRNVDPASTLQVVNALIKADKDFDFLYMVGSGHGACESRYGKRRRADFFVRHLHGVEPRK